MLIQVVRVLKKPADVMAGPLLILHQMSWESGEVPAGWNLAMVAPIHKKGTREDLGNYRPLSLTQFLEKLWRRLY